LLLISQVPLLLLISQVLKPWSGAFVLHSTCAQYTLFLL
jgi:hypothetical protein